MKVTRRHRLGVGRARDWVDHEIVSILNQFGDNVSDVSNEGWKGDTLRFSFRAVGMRFRGKLIVSDSALTVDVGFPLLARPFQGQAEAEVEAYLDSNLPTV